MLFFVGLTASHQHCTSLFCMYRSLLESSCNVQHPFMDICETERKGDQRQVCFSQPNHHFWLKSSCCVSELLTGLKVSRPKLPLLFKLAISVCELDWDIPSKNGLNNRKTKKKSSISHSTFNQKPKQKEKLHELLLFANITTTCSS